MSLTKHLHPTVIGLCLLTMHSFGQTTESQNDDVVELPLFEISTQNDQGYGSNSTLGGTRIITPIDKSPGTVVTLNREMMDDILAQEVIDAAKYVSGVSKVATNHGGNFSVRGYNLDRATHRDGLPNGGTMNDVVDMVDIERMEIIKGPTGVVYGAHILGGIVNRVGKRPLNDPLNTVNFTIGDYNFARLEIDATGPVPRSDTMLYRLAFAYQDAETQWGGKNNRTSINPMVTYKISKQTEFFARASYNHVQQDFGGGWFIDPNNSFSTFIPPDFDGGQMDGAFSEWWVYQLELELKHSFSGLLGGDWKLRFNGRYNFHDRYENSVLREFNLLRSDGTQLARSTEPEGTFDNPLWGGDIRFDLAALERREDEHNSTVSVDLAGNFSAGVTDHTMLTYMEVQNISQDYLYYSYPEFTSVYLSQRNPVSITERGEGTLNRDTQRGTTSFAYGIQDNMELIDGKVVLVGGARYDRAEDKTSGDTNQDWSFKFGGIYQPITGLSLFYNYSQTFNPAGGSVDDGMGGLLELENREGENNEFGLKFNLWNSKLTGTVSYFDMSLTNIVLSEVTTNPDGSITQIRTLGGVNETDGWEADLAYQPVPSITLLAGVGDLTSRTEKGVRQRGVPEGVNYKILGKYTFQNGIVKGLGLGLGFVHVPDRAGDRADSFSLPSYEEWDAFAYYSWREWRFQINVRNLSDEVFVKTGASRTVMSAAEPRNVRLTVRRSF